MCESNVGAATVAIGCRFRSLCCGAETREEVMLRWAILFFILAIVAAVLGFGGIAADAAWIGRILLLVFLVLFVASLVFGRRRP